MLQIVEGLACLMAVKPDTDLKLLLEILPADIQKALEAHDLSSLIEIVLDLGRVPEARFRDGHFVLLGSQDITEEAIEGVVKHIGFFTTDNRGGIPRTLHRISALRNRHGKIVGLTCRVGKVVTGTIEAIRDLIESGKSVLIMGKPGVGKTTKLREIAKLLADSDQKRVVIVDTSNEIAGDGDIPHPAVGRARRLQVPIRERQKEVMVEAVQNHTPEVIIVDEIGTEDEALASRTIAERGVVLVATAHGQTLENIIKNPTLSDLVGGIETVTLGDEEAKRRSTQKTVLERAKQPTFDIAIEIRDQNTYAVYRDVADAVDQILRGWTIFPEIRKVDAETGDVKVLQSDVEPGMIAIPEEELHEAFQDDEKRGQKSFYVYIYGISKTFVERILERMELHHVGLTRQITEANAIVALRNSCRPGSKMMRVAEDYEIPVHFAKSNTLPQILKAFRESINAEVSDIAEQFTALNAQDEGDETQVALNEALEAIERVKDDQHPVELEPRRSYIRRLQHELVEKYGLYSTSMGDEPLRRIKVMPSKPL